MIGLKGSRGGPRISYRIEAVGGEVRDGEARCAHCVPNNPSLGTSPFDRRARLSALRRRFVLATAFHTAEGHWYALAEGPVVLQF
jgi:hypothetical protein